MKVLITGMSGFIGLELARLFLAAGDEVTGLYRRNRPELSDSIGRLSLFQCDLVEGLAKIPAVELVIHAAGHTHLIPGSQAEDYIRNNLQAGLQLNDYLRQTLPQHVIYLSTLSVYGTIEVAELCESTPLNQPGIYGLSKYMGEKILTEVSQQLPVTCLRLPGVVGKDYFEPWLGKVLAKALKNEEITIYNGSGSFNNILDSQELYRFIRHLYERGAPAFDQLNLAATEPLLVREMVNCLLNEVGSSSPISELASENSPFTISTEKLRREYSFVPRSTREMVEAYGRCNRR